jgi:uncharacterized protein with GYD domain
MPKYLFHGSYTLEGVRGLIKEGGSSRRSHFKVNVGNLGGEVEAFYYAFGAEDIYAIVDLPDNVSGAAISLALGAGGGFRGSTIVLLTPEEVDQAAQKVVSVGYRPPGQ